MENNHTEGRKVERVLLLVLFAGLFILVALLFRPFFSVLIWATLVYGLVQPLYRRLTTRRDGSERSRLVRSLCAGLFSLGTLFLIVLPLTLLGMVFVGQLRELFGVVADLLNKATALLHSEGFRNVSAGLFELSGGAIDLGSMNVLGELRSVASGYGQQLVSLSAAILGNLAGLAVTMAFFLFVMFFLFLDGKELLFVFIDAMPLKNAYTIVFVHKFRDTSKELFLGYVLVALFQGAMAFLVYTVMSVPAPLPLAILSAVASFIPMVGTALVWFPLVLVRLSTGPWLEAALLFLLSAVFISSLDNFIKPFLLHARIKLHPLLIFIAIVGGIKLFGFDGLLLGPIILVLFFTAVDMFGKLYGRTRRRPEQGEAPALPEACDEGDAVAGDASAGQPEPRA